MHNTPTPSQPVEAIAVAGPPTWRIRLVCILQILGVAAGAMGTAEFMNVLQALSPELAAWFLVSGVALRFGAEPTVVLLGDLLDDGVRNDSFKIPKPGQLMPVLLWGAIGFFLFTQFSCSNLNIPTTFSITTDGCALMEYTAANGQKYKAGPCVGPDGKIDRYIVQWEAKVEGSESGDTVVARVVRYTKDGVIKTYYKAGDGSWIEWSSKSGLTLSPPPAAEVTPVKPTP